MIDRISTDILLSPLSLKDKKFVKEDILPLIENNPIKVNYSRKNSGVGRTQVFGYGGRRGLGFGEFANNSNYPELFKALVELGERVVPDFIPWTAIQVNKNYQTIPHRDAHNIGLSFSFSFGDFSGGELVVDGQPFQTRLAPLVFNGALLEHYNKPISGDRYSLVYFVSAPKDMTDKEIFQLHNYLIKKSA